MLFLEVILLSTLSKMSNYMIKTSKLCLDPILLDSTPLNYVKKSGSKALLKIALNSSFLYFPLVYSLFRHSFHSLNLLWYGLNTFFFFFFWMWKIRVKKLIISQKPHCSFVIVWFDSGVFGV